jgi:hypothetical protein
VVICLPNEISFAFISSGCPNCPYLLKYEVSNYFANMG